MIGCAASETRGKSTHLRLVGVAHGLHVAGALVVVVELGIVVLEIGRRRWGGGVSVYVCIHGAIGIGI